MRPRFVVFKVRGEADGLPISEAESVGSAATDGGQD